MPPCVGIVKATTSPFEFMPWFGLLVNTFMACEDNELQAGHHVLVNI